MEGGLCEGCGEEVTPDKWHPVQRFCSKSCYQSAPEQRKRERELRRTPERREQRREYERTPERKAKERERERKRQPTPEQRERELERNRERYYNLSGEKYSKRLLLGRRRKALKRMEERNRRLEVELG